MKLVSSKIFNNPIPTRVTIPNVQGQSKPIIKMILVTLVSHATNGKMLSKLKTHSTLAIITSGVYTNVLSRLQHILCPFDTYKRSRNFPHCVKEYQKLAIKHIDISPSVP